MLLSISWLAMISQELPRMLRIRSYPRNGVEFMIAQDALSCARFDHAPHEAHCGQLFRSAVDQIAHKDGSTAGMPPNALGFGIAEVR